MRRDPKNNIYINYLNSDADCSFAAASNWNAGRRTIDLRAANQYVDAFLVGFKVLAIGTTVTFKLQQSADNSTWTDVIPFKDQHSAANWDAITAAGFYAVEYRDTDRWVRLTAAAQTGTLVGYGFLTGTSQRLPVDRSVWTPAT
jgi:hypothetical protein